MRAVYGAVAFAAVPVAQAAIGQRMVGTSVVTEALMEAPRTGAAVATDGRVAPSDRAARGATLTASSATAAATAAVLLMAAARGARRSRRGAAKVPLRAAVAEPAKEEVSALQQEVANFSKKVEDAEQAKSMWQGRVEEARSKLQAVEGKVEGLAEATLTWAQRAEATKLRYEVELLTRNVREAEQVRAVWKRSADKAQAKLAEAASESSGSVQSQEANLEKQLAEVEATACSAETATEEANLEKQLAEVEATAGSAEAATEEANLEKELAEVETTAGSAEAATEEANSEKELAEVESTTGSAEVATEKVLTGWKKWMNKAMNMQGEIKARSIAKKALAHAEVKSQRANLEKQLAEIEAAADKKGKAASPAPPPAAPVAAAAPPRSVYAAPPPNSYAAAARARAERVRAQKTAARKAELEAPKQGVQEAEMFQTQ